MEFALAQARLAEQQNEVPIGAVVVRDDQLIGQGYNQVISLHDPTAHAEVMALRDAALHESNYRLPNTTLYVTLEPCVMCAGALIHARVGRLVFAAKEPRTGAAGSVFDLLPPDKRFNHSLEIESGVLAEQSADMLRQFFRKRRK